MSYAAILPIEIAITMLSLLAGPYKLFAWKLRTFGGIGAGIMTWLGVFWAHPKFVWGAPPEHRDKFEILSHFLCSMALMVVLAWVHMFAKWCSSKPRRDDCEFHSWFGRWEAAITIPLCGLVAIFWLEPTGAFLLFGYVCTVAQVQLARLRRRIDGCTTEDVERMAGKFRVASGLVKAAATGGVSLGARLIPPRRTSDAPAAGTTFFGRVWSNIFAYFIIHSALGVIGFKAFFAVFSLLWSIPLWMTGHTVEYPETVEEGQRSTIQKLKEKFRGGEKADADDPLASDEAGFDLDADDLKERMKHLSLSERRKLHEEIERRKREAMWNFITGRGL